jgi:SAM-dependent methyltransferase
MTSAADAYAFGAGDLAAERLAVVHRVFAPLAHRLLDDAVRVAPRAVVDLGCGPGHTTALLADRWPMAAVTAVERAPAFAAAARRRVPRATVVEGDVTEPATLPAGAADLVYARCLLAHLPDVAGTVRTWRRWVRPHGLLALEEPERIDTEDDAFTRYLAATTAAVAARGAVMLAGPAVHVAAGEVGDVVVDRVVALPVATADAAAMFALNLSTIRHDPAAGLSLAAADELAGALDARRSDPSTGRITWHVRQVVLAAGP